MPTTWTGLTDQQRISYNKVMLGRAKPYTPGFTDAKKASIPEREGKTVNWRILGGASVLTTGAGLALATTPLGEGTPPSETAMTAAKVEATVSQYGAFVKATDLAVHQTIDPLWSEIFALLGEQAGQTLHTLLMNSLLQTASAQFAGAATSTATVAAAMIMTGAEVREVHRTLERQKVQKFPDGFYHGIMHTNVAFDLRADADFKTSQMYNGGLTSGGGNSMITNEIRDWMGVRWMVTTDAPIMAATGVGGIPVYATIVYGPGYYGAVDLTAQRMGSVSDDGVSGLQVRAVGVDVATKDDPLGQFGTAGWKCAFAGKILQDWKGQRIESAATV